MEEPEPVCEIYVLPGESHLVRAPALLRTVLGSCVGITFRNPRLGIAGLVHPMLPVWSETARRLGRAEGLAEGRRYVDFAIRDMAEKLDRLGADRSGTEVKLFGGADVLMEAAAGRRPTIGRLNCEAALRTLRAEGFSVAVSKLGGRSGVHIQFDAASGEILLRHLKSGRSR